MELGIGTVQLGMDYGISNQEGQTDQAEAQRILEVAVKNQIRLIDTASSYGISEEVLGKILLDDYDFHIVTKTPAFSKPEITADDARRLEETLHRSLARLKCSSVYGLLIHVADDLLANGGVLLMEKMSDLKQAGLVEKIGVSVYTAQEIDKIMAKYRLDIIQLPINVLNQRLLHSGHLSKLKQAGVEIHARSVFLQGLLLMDVTQIPAYLKPVKGHLKNYHDFIRQKGFTPLQAAWGFVMGLDAVDIGICGVNNARQLEEICANARPITDIDFNRFAVSEEAILNPAKWKV